MIFLPVVILAVIQGITEFLPISSSGHLVLAHQILPDAGTSPGSYDKILDIAVHVGTLIAVIIYFFRDVRMLFRGAVDTVMLKHRTPPARLFRHVAIATIPVIIGGLYMFRMNIGLFDNVAIMAWMTLIFGVVLYIADRSPENDKAIDRVTWKQSLIFGLAQMLALVPGVSRSGITMTAGRFMGYNRTESARFSLLMGMAAIAGAGLLVGCSLLADVTVTGEFWGILGIGAFVSCITAYAAIWAMMRWLSSASFTPFVIYRVILGVVLLALIYGGVIPQDMQG